MSNVARTAVAVYLSSCEQAKTSVIVEFLDALHDGSRQCFLSDRQPPLNDTDVSCISNALKQPHHMRVLDLYSNDISSYGVTAILGALAERPNVLRELRLGNVQMTDSTAEIIAEAFAQNQIGLRVLDLSQNQITEVGCNALARIFVGENSPILELSLHSNSLGPGCAGAITQLALCDRIRHLHLGRNDLGDATAVELARALPQCRTISTLDLSENNIGFQGGHALAQALVGQGSAINNGVCLQRLNLRGNLLNADALTAFVRVVQENRNLTQLFVGCNEGQPHPDQTQQILKALLENDVLLLLDIVGWPLPPGTAWDVADSILSSDSGVRAIVSDAFDDVFEYIDGANHDRTQRGQQSIYFGVNEYIGASAVAAATASNTALPPSNSGKARSPSSSQQQQQQRQQQQQSQDFNNAPPPPANLESTSRSPDRNNSRALPLQEQQQQPQENNSNPFNSRNASPPQQPGMNRQQQQQQQQQQDQQQQPPTNNNAYARRAPASSSYNSSSNNVGNNNNMSNNNSRNYQQQQQQNLNRNNNVGGRSGNNNNNSNNEQQRLQDCEREIDAVNDNINQTQQQQGYDAVNPNESSMARVMSEVLASLRRAHEKIAELERRDAEKSRQIEDLKREQAQLQRQQQQQAQNQQQQQQQQPPLSRSSSTPVYGNQNQNNNNQQQQGQNQQNRFNDPYNNNNNSRYNNNNNGARGNPIETPASARRRGDPGTPYQQQNNQNQQQSREDPWGNNNQNNNYQNQNNNNSRGVPPLRLNNVQDNNNQRSNSPVKGVSTTKGPGGTSSSAANTNRDASPSTYNDSTYGNSRSESQAAGGPTLHPYWKHTTPERARELESARDRPTQDDNFEHVASIPHAGNAKVRIDAKGEDCPTPSLQQSVKVDPSQPLMHVPAPQTPPPRPTVPRATT